MKKHSYIKDLRLRLGLSQQRFGKRVNVSRSSVAFYESFEREPRKKTAYKIINLAKEYGIEATLEDIYPKPPINQFGEYRQ